MNPEFSLYSYYYVLMNFRYLSRESYCVIALLSHFIYTYILCNSYCDKAYKNKK